MVQSRSFEEKSCAATLSDMELFIFPDLLFALVLANIMSPRIWRWREDPWFKGIEKMTPYRRITRLKQYIMDHYIFNLDLDTWGLTSRQREINRFKEFIDIETVKQSNALFGYEGDKYYFDIGIRTHFGLDKYGGEVIPYWKTETVEAMDAFVFRPNYGNGAGECVSLSTLYAAALYIVAGIPLKDIFLLATPLHSQNFVDLDGGILTNNRRLVTKAMWVNGSVLSAQARRALENEKVTIVSHESGTVHYVYPEVTIDKNAYLNFEQKIKAFLKSDFNTFIFGNFLRHRRDLQKCFQFRWNIAGKDMYIPVETVFAYEHDGPYLFTDNTRAKLLAEIDSDEFRPIPLSSRKMLNDLEDFVKTHSLDFDRPEDVAAFKGLFEDGCLHREEIIESLINFCHVVPRLPDIGAKTFMTNGTRLGLELGMTRDQVIERLESLRGSNKFADLAFYAYRDLNRVDHEAFIKAAIERNPVCCHETKEMDTESILAAVEQMPDESIYDDEGRLSQPDEVWNYKRGDALEKALLLATIFYCRAPKSVLQIEVSDDKVSLKGFDGEYHAVTKKGLKDLAWKIEGYNPPEFD